MLDILGGYCNKNELVINTKKTKILVFRKGGRNPNITFKIQNGSIETVSEYKYLVIIFTPQLTFTKHVESLIARAKAKIGYMFARTPVKEVSLDLAKRLFNCYILPIFEFNMIIWTENFSDTVKEKLDDVWKSFLKRYCIVHPKTRTDIVHWMTNSIPLSKTILKKCMRQITNMNLSLNLDKNEFSLINDRRKQIPDEYNNYLTIPNEFWNQNLPVFVKMPSRSQYRKTLCYKIVDGNHRKICTNTNPKDFHLTSKPQCICKYCGNHASWRHCCI